MTQIVPVYSTTMQNLKSRVSEFINHPTNIARVKLEHLAEISGSEVNFVDPTSPWAFQLEASSVAVSSAVDEMSSSLRKLYPKLASTQDDLYRHMSDIDYIDRFAAPSTCEMTIAVSVEDINTKTHEYTTTDGFSTFRYREFVIPRSSFIKVGGYIFTFEHTIHLRVNVINAALNNTNDLGSADEVKTLLTVFYDTTVASPLQNISTSVIDYEVRIDQSGKLWVYFKVPLLQTQITTVMDVMHQSSLYSKVIPHPDKFHHLRAFYRNSVGTNNQWIEMDVTHSRDVYDVSLPTLVVKKLESSIEVTMPLVYSTAGVSGELMLLVYSTKGQIGQDMSSYLVNDYVCNIADVYQNYTDTNSNSYKAIVAMSKSNYFTFSTQKFSGGADEVDFDTLRINVIYNTLGDRKLPITNVQLTSNQITREGFELVKNIDVITNRAYLAVRKLPRPEQNSILTPANFGIAQAHFNMGDFLSMPDIFKINGTRITLMSETLFNDVDGIVKALTAQERHLINSYPVSASGDLKPAQQKATDINKEQYMYNPFYYVLSVGGQEFSSRAYDLDNPSMGIMSYELDDVRFGIAVATKDYEINRNKSREGFVIRFTTSSSNEYRTLVSNALSLTTDMPTLNQYEADALSSFVQAQVSHYSDMAGKWVHHNCIPVSVINGEVTYEVLLRSNFDINESDEIAITNACVSSADGNETAYVKIDTTFKIIHIAKTNSTITSTINQHVNTNLISTSYMSPVSMQSVKTKIGTSLKNLWSKSRSFQSDSMYERYEDDVYMTYTEDQRVIDPVTGSTFAVVGNSIMLTPVDAAKAKGMPVLHDGQPVLLYKKGDIVMENGLPKLIPGIDAQRHAIDRSIDIFFVDGKYLLATSERSTNYRKEISTIVVGWITQNIQRLQDVLLDQSRIYFYPKTTLSKINAWVDNKSDTILDAEQSLKVDLYVTSRIYNSEELRKELQRLTILTIDKFIDKAYVSVSDIMVSLRNTYNQEVKGLKLYGLGGSNDFQVLMLKDDYNRMCIKKKLVARLDGTLDVDEDITVSFYNIDRLFNN